MTSPTPQPKRTSVGAVVRALRPHQWVKNVFVLVPLVFAGPELRAAGRLTESLILHVLLGVLAFCLQSSATDLLNDLHDVEADRRHPVKRLRPIAAGELPVPAAWTWFWAILATAAVLSWLAGGLFIAYVAAYFVMNTAYSKGLKHVAWVDAAVISAGFVLRILAGAEVAHVHVSHWLVGCTVLLSLFQALGKRKHELLTSDTSHRIALMRYQKAHLNVALPLLAWATAGVYLGYTLDPDTARRFGTHLLPWTVPFPLLGMWRFAKLLDDAETPRSPTERMLRDPLFVANLAAWALTVGLLIYGVVGSA